VKETIRISSSSAIVLVLFTLAFTGLMATTFFATKPAIDESIRAEKMQLIGEVLPESLEAVNSRRAREPKATTSATF